MCLVESINNGKVVFEMARAKLTTGKVSESDQLLFAVAATRVQ